MRSVQRAARLTPLGAISWAERLLQADPGPLGRGIILVCVVALALAVVTLRLSVTAYLAVSLTLLLPTMLVAWYLGMAWGLGMAFFVVLTWLAADLVGMTPTVPHSVLYFNSGVRAGVFGVVAALVAGLRQAYRRQRVLAAIDPLTGLANRRHFMTLAENERKRAARFGHALTLAFLDLDGFKAINDRYGHEAGDAALRLVGAYLRKRLRSIDSAARLGGDEFVLLLPETGEASGRYAVRDVQQGVVTALEEAGLGVGLSAGVATFLKVPDSVDEMLRTADRLMYAAKREGVNSLQQAAVAATPSEPDRPGLEAGAGGSLHRGSS